MYNNNNNTLPIKTLFDSSILTITSETSRHGNTIIMYYDRDVRKKATFRLYALRELINKRNYKLCIMLKNYERDKEYKLAAVNYNTMESKFHNNINVYNIECILPVGSGRTYDTFHIYLLLCKYQNNICLNMTRNFMYKVEIYKYFPGSRRPIYPFQQVINRGLDLISKVHYNRYITYSKVWINPMKNISEICPIYNYDYSPKKRNERMLRFVSYMYTLMKDKDSRILRNTQWLVFSNDYNRLMKAMTKSINYDLRLVDSYKFSYAIMKYKNVFKHIFDSCFVNKILYNKTDRQNYISYLDNIVCAMNQYINDNNHNMNYNIHTEVISSNLGFVASVTYVNEDVICQCIEFLRLCMMSENNLYNK